MTDNETVSVKVWGPLACFTRPELKVERVSYPVMTPSAARGILEAICWKPQFRWIVRKIYVLKPIQFVGIRRNEVQDKISPRVVAEMMRNPDSFTPYFADSAGRDDIQGEHRTQRNTLALRDVAYIIEASVEVYDRYVKTDPPIKYREMFLRRVEKGQCFQQPYLGLREFVAHFSKPTDDDRPIPDSMDLGWMLFDLEYEEQGRGIPLFAQARLENGVLDVDSMRRNARPQEVMQ